MPLWLFLIAPRAFVTERDGLWSVLGMKIDARRRHLWAASAAHRQMSGFKEEEEGASAVFKFDLRTGKLIKKYVLANKPARHLLGDLMLDGRGDVYVTDSLTPAVYRIPRGTDELEPFVAGAPFVSPQGLDLAPGGRALFVADYSRGVFARDLRTRAARLLPHPETAMLLGIDGLYFHRGSLVAVQNGANPQRVVRLRLSPALDREGRLAPPDKLREHVILKLKL